MAMSPARRRWMVAVATGVAMLVTARMGLWQLDRAAQKLALQAAIEGASQASPLEQAALARDVDAAQRQMYRPVTLHGRWLADQTVYLDNRQMQGRPGFFVLTPLLLAPGDAVMVQRGWLPRDASDRTRLQPIVTAAADVRVVGRIAPPPSRLVSLGAEQAGVIRQNIDLTAEATRLGLNLRPLSVVQLDRPADAPDGLLRDWPLPALDVQKHYGYAVQWFAMCAMLAGLFLWFQLLKPRRDTSS
jgi:surfeit locus 1 family protein